MLHDHALDHHVLGARIERPIDVGVGRRRHRRLLVDDLRRPDLARPTVAELRQVLRKRTDREVADARLYGNASFARDVLAVADNMHRALGTIEAELREHADVKMQALIEGVELTERELMKVLEKHGVRKFTPEGEKFDPNLHQAMYEIPTQDLPAGHVAQVMQAGYMLGERVLRPAMVGVSKGAAKAAPKGSPAYGNDSAAE